MKKIISLSIFLVALLGAVISFHSMNTNNNLENSLLLANIEALTDSSEGGSSGGSWLKGYKMQSIDVKVGKTVSGSIGIVVSADSGISIGFGYTVSYETINCCKRDTPGTDCNKSGNESKCSYLTLD